MWKSTADTSSLLEEVKQLRQLEKESFSITTERSINWCVGETVLFQQWAVMGKIAFSCTKYHVHSSVQTRTQVLINYWACLKRHLGELHKSQSAVLPQSQMGCSWVWLSSQWEGKRKVEVEGREGNKTRESEEPSPWQRKSYMVQRRPPGCSIVSPM